MDKPTAEPDADKRDGRTLLAVHEECQRFRRTHAAATGRPLHAYNWALQIAGHAGDIADYVCLQDEDRFYDALMQLAALCVAMLSDIDAVRRLRDAA